MSIWQPACQASSATEEVIWSFIDDMKMEQLHNSRCGELETACVTQRRPCETYLSPIKVNYICKLSRRQFASLRLVVPFPFQKLQVSVKSPKLSYRTALIEDKRQRTVASIANNDLPTAHAD